MLKVDRIELKILELVLKSPGRRMQYRLGDLSRELAKLLDIEVSSDETADTIFVLAKQEVLLVGIYIGLEFVALGLRDLSQIQRELFECRALAPAGRRYQELSRGNRNGIFISHITPEREAARHLKTLFQNALAPEIPIFVSSDYDSITSGDWYHAILKGLRESGVIITLLSPVSCDARWINFEAGFGVGQETEVIPIVWRGLDKASIGMPLERLQARSLHDAKDMEALLKILAAVYGLSANTEHLDPFMARLPAIEANTKYTDLVVQLFRTKANQIRMSIRNLGARQIELIEAAMLMPQALVGSNNFHEYQPVLKRCYWTDEQDVKYVGAALTVHASNVLHLGVNPLTPILTREMGECVLDYPGIHLRGGLADDDLNLSIRYWVLCKERSFGPAMQPIREIPCREM